MTNAERIVSTLDSLLDHEVSLVIYGRAAVALGFTSPPREVANSLDVDVILRDSHTAALDADDQFWDSQAAVNAKLDREGLYMTHLFGERQVFLRRQWESEILPVLRPPLKFLRLFRPATIDLILTKMMRGNDEQDMQDVDFMIRHDRVTQRQIEDAFRDAVIPDVVELRDAYALAKPTVLALAQKAAADGFSLPRRTSV
jgi:hypothetical protein